MHSGLIPKIVNQGTKNLSSKLHSKNNSRHHPTATFSLKSYNDPKFVARLCRILESSCTSRIDTLHCAACITSFIRIVSALQHFIVVLTLRKRQRYIEANTLMLYEQFPKFNI